MKKMTKHLRIRITEQQFKKLAEALINEHMSKSSLIRQIIEDYYKKDLVEKCNKE